MRIGISGIGTSVGLGILKSIRNYSKDLFVVGIDNRITAHSYMVDKFTLMAKVEKLNSRSQIIKIIKENKIQVLLIASEYEIDWYAYFKNEIEEKTKAKIAVAPIKWINLGNNKLKTYDFLNSINLPIAPYFYFNIKKKMWLSSNQKNRLKKKDFPAFLKPNKGTSNKGIIYFESKKDLEIYVDNGNNIEDKVLQKSLNINSDCIEVTSSIIVDKKGYLPFKPFHAKRTLNKGISWKIERIKSNFLDKYLLKTINSMPDYYGSLNMQFIGSEKTGFFPLEINTRFSGTTSFRLACNRNEVMFVIKDLLKQDTSELIRQSNNELSPVMHRYVEDFIV